MVFLEPGQLPPSIMSEMMNHSTYKVGSLNQFRIDRFFSQLYGRGTDIVKEIMLLRLNSASPFQMKPGFSLEAWGYDDLIKNTPAALLNV